METKVRKTKVNLSRLNILTKEAMQAIKFRGHKPKYFKRDYEKGIAVYMCPCCKKAAVVRVSPSFNEAEITGEAVALNCENKEEK